MNAIYNNFRRLSAYIQRPKDSFTHHNRQYEALGKLEDERTIGINNIKNDAINDTSFRVRDILTAHPEVDTAVDIGSGTGWSAAATSPLVDRVIAIEPSEAAVVIARELYPASTYPNITWIIGFAETELHALTLTSPTLFFTGCVFSHLRDTEVKKICKVLGDVAPAGSVLSFAECWGDEAWHQLMWHVRTKEWWRTQLPGWELDFHGPQVPGERYHKGIWGVKVK